MNITHGLLPGQVLQRNAQNKGHVLITGTAKNGALEYRVLKDGKAVGKFTWTRAGAVEKKRFMLAIGGLPCGGPYQVELRVRDQRKTIDDYCFNQRISKPLGLPTGQGVLIKF